MHATSTDSERPEFRPARLHDDDWVVDGAPVVADGIEPEESVEVDRFACVACSAQLDVLVGLDDEAPGREPFGTHRLAPLERRVTCPECNVEQAALAAGGEWQPQRYVIVAIGTRTAPAPSPDDRSSLIAVAVVVLVVALLVAGNAAAVLAWRGDRHTLDAGRPITATIDAASSSGGPRVVPSYSLRLSWQRGDAFGTSSVEVDESTFLRFDEGDEIEVRELDGEIAIPGNHEQRNDLFAMLAIDLAIIATIIGIALWARTTTRNAGREPRA